MSYPLAIAIVGWFAAVSVFGVAFTSSRCFLEWLKTKRQMEVDLTPILKRLEDQDQAIVNVAKQTVDEVSKLRDRMGTMSLALGMKPKEPKP